MEKKLDELLSENIDENKIIKIVMSNKKIKTDELKKIEIKLYKESEELLYQVSYIYEKNTIHKNYSLNDIKDVILNLYNEKFKQMALFAIDADYQILSGKNLKIIKSNPTKKYEIFSHNRKKQYILNEGENIPFLIKLGVMSENFKIKNDKYDKFKQINRYLEIFDDVFENISDKNDINIIDFGCGKAYLSFALYYFLKIIKNKDINISGLDLKEDVIEFCNKLSEELS